MRTLIKTPLPKHAYSPITSTVQKPNKKILSSSHPHFKNTKRKQKLRILNHTLHHTVYTIHTAPLNAHGREEDSDYTNGTGPPARKGCHLHRHLDGVTSFQEREPINVHQNAPTTSTPKHLPQAPSQYTIPVLHGQPGSTISVAHVQHGSRSSTSTR